MKIEMGESLCVSWLKHVKGCQIVQMNWRPSCFWDHSRYSKVAIILNDIDQKLRGRGCRLFPRKKGTGTEADKELNVRQILDQAECDVVGIRFDIKGKPLRFYGIESAFHSDGLHYKNNAEKVAGKLLKVVLSLYLHFGAKKIDAIFVTPEVKKGEATKLQKLLGVINEVLREDEYKKLFICKMGFCTRVKKIEDDMDGYISFSDNLFRLLAFRIPFTDDDSELFMRSMLMREFGVGNIVPVRSRLRSAWRSLGCPNVEKLDKDSVSCLKDPNERSALNRYVEWKKEI